MNRTVIQIKYENLVDAIAYLAEHHSVVLTNLPNKHALIKARNIVKLAASILQDHEYNIILHILHQQSRPTHLIPNSAGAFLFGSYQDCYGDVSQSCSPIAIGSLHDNKQEYVCADNVFIFHRDKHGTKSYYALVRNDSQRAYIYVDDDFRAFSAPEIGMLKELNILELAVFKTNSSKHYTILPFTPITKVAILSSVNVIANRSSVMKDKHEENNQDVNTTILQNNDVAADICWPIIIIIVVIIIIILWLWWFYHHNI